MARGARTLRRYTVLGLLFCGCVSVWLRSQSKEQRNGALSSLDILPPLTPAQAAPTKPPLLVVGIDAAAEAEEFIVQKPRPAAVVHGNVARRPEVPPVAVT